MEVVEPVKAKSSSKFCQSKFYKDWNPDQLSDYNR
jgi:hypothetical protein